MKKYGVLSLKLTILILAISWAISQGVLAQSIKGIEAISGVHLIWAWICMGLGVLLGPVRWSLLLNAVHLTKPPMRLATRFYYEGLFYNTLLPGAIGGDLLRAHWLKKTDYSNSKLHYMVTLGERALGVFSLGFLYAIAQLEISFIFIAIICIGFILYYKASLIRLLPNSWIQGSHLLAMILDFTVQTRFIPLVLAFAVNLCSHLLSFTLLVIMASDLGIYLPWSIWFSCLSLSMFAANLPISIAGIGPREATLIATLAPYGVEQQHALTLSLAMLALLITHALLGGLFHLLSNNQFSKSDRSTSQIN
jgi:glycosyltransferase 2 family protein